MHKNGITKNYKLLDHKDEDDPRFEQKSGILSMTTIIEIIVRVMIAKFNTEIVKPFLCDYSDSYILVTGDIKVQDGDDDTRVAIEILF